jgi:hypothetical protein
MRALPTFINPAHRSHTDLQRRGDLVPTPTGCTQLDHHGTVEHRPRSAEISLAGSAMCLTGSGHAGFGRMVGRFGRLLRSWTNPGDDTEGCHCAVGGAALADMSLTG